MSDASETGAANLEFEALAQAWPRPLIAAGRAERLARWWCESRVAAIERGAAPFPRLPATAALWRALFEARRARRLLRGLELIAKVTGQRQERSAEWVALGLTGPR